jgi:parallel beta-helix repeat protein
MKGIRIFISMLVCLMILSPLAPLQALTVKAEIPAPEGPVVEIFADQFDDPDNYGSTGSVTIPAPWVQEGANKSAAKTSASSSAPSVPNMVKIDSADSLVLSLDLTGYGNIQVSYYTRASSYTSGSILVEWSNDEGSTWTVLEDYKLPAGKASEPNTKKEWHISSDANNNSKTKLRFRAGDPMSANMYIDSVAVMGQAIPGISPAPSPVPVIPPVEQPPFNPPAGVKMYEDVLIGMAGNRQMYASIAVPENPPAESMPAMVYIHGGGWNHGDRKQALTNISNYVLKRGYIGISLDYRLTPEAPFPAQIQDVKLGIRYLRAHAADYFIDPSRIGVWGSSAGGHLASLLGTTGDMVPGADIVLDNGNTVQVPDLGGNGGWPEYSDKVQAVADWYGPADFTTEFANSYSSVTALLGGKKAFTVPNEARLAMPGTYASPDDPPFWIRHGNADATIPYQDSVVFAQQLTAAGVPVVDFKLVPGQGHGFTGAASEEANAEAWVFMDQHVKNRTVTQPIIYKPGYGPGGTDPGGPGEPGPGDPGNPGNPGNPGAITVELDTKALEMTAGSIRDISAVVASPAAGDSPSVTWSAYDGQVAQVSSTGPLTARVTAVSPGTTRITASVVSAVYGQATSEAVVTVKPSQQEPPGQVVEKEVAKLLPTDDALIDSSLPDTNLNSATGSSQGLFSVSTSSSKKKYVYFKYSITGDNANPDYKYEFQVASKKGSINTDTVLSLYGITDSSWTESGLTWSNAPVKDLAQAEFLGTVNVTADKAGNPQVYTVDVSGFVQSRLEAGTAAFILADAEATGVSVNIYTKEANGTSNPHPSMLVKEIVDLSGDVNPPYWPEGSALSAVNLGMDFIDLKWPEAMDDSRVDYYLVYQNGALAAKLVQEESFSITGLQPGTAYTFRVEAVDASGKTSVGSLTLTRTTLTDPILPLTVEGVTASSSDGNVEINTIDNNSYTRWSTAGEGQWIMYDLGETKRVGYLGVGFYKGDIRRTLIDIETSLNGTDWSRAFSGWTSSMTTAMQPFDIEDTDARYVRIVGYGNNDGSSYTSLTDVHIYPPFANGDTPVAVIPYILPGPPPGAVPFTLPGMRNADGSDHSVHTPNAVTGRTLKVTDYGADPLDNGTDDRAAIQAAIDAAHTGDEVYFPNGVYNLLSSPDGLSNLTLKSGVNLRGESQDGAVLKTSLHLVKNSTLFKAVRQHDFVISNLTLTSAWNGSYTTDHKINNPEGGGPDSLIVIANYGDEPSYNVTIDQVTVEKFRRMAIRIDNSHDVAVRGSTFRNATDVGPGGSGYGVSIQGIAKTDRLGYANDTRWNLVEDSSFEGPYLRHGALIQFVAHNNVIRNNVFNQTKLDAIDLHGELEYLNEIYGNLVTNILTGGAVGLGNTGGTAPSNHSKSGPGNLIRDNVIRNSREGVVVTMGTPDTVIENNVLENTVDIPGASGIKVLNGPGTVIRRNIIRSNTAPDYWAILLQHDNGDTNAGYIGEGDPENVRIQGNTLTRNSNGIGLHAGTGIVLRGNTVESLGTNFYQAEGVQAVLEETSGNARLSSIGVSKGTLSPAFNPDVLSYSFTLPYGTSALAVTPETEDSMASVTVNNQAAVSGTPVEIALTSGSTMTIPVKVTAEDRTVKSYTILVQWQSGSGGSGGSSGNGSAGPAPSDIPDEASEQPVEPIAVGLEQIEQALENAADGTVRLDIGRAASDKAAVRLDSAALQRLTEMQSVNELLVESDLGAYILPLQQVRLKEWAERQGAAPAGLQVEVAMLSNAQAMEEAASSGLSVLKAVDFTVTVKATDGRELELTDFTQYVQRVIHMDAPLQEHGLAVVRVTAGGIGGEAAYEPVPFRVDGSAVRIFSRTNSTYMLLESKADLRDMAEHWARTEVEALAAKRIVQGSGQQMFHPDESLTRAELAALLVRTLGLSGSEIHAGSGAFTDINGKEWYTRDVKAAAEAGIVTGYEDGTFRPQAGITRQELAVMLHRAIGFAGAREQSLVLEKNFLDDQVIAPWAQESVAAAASYKLMDGISEGRFAPEAPATRAESAVVLFRLLSVLDFSK